MQKPFETAFWGPGPRPAPGPQPLGLRFAVPAVARILPRHHTRAQGSRALELGGERVIGFGDEMADRRAWSRSPTTACAARSPIRTRRSSTWCSKTVRIDWMPAMNYQRSLKRPTFCWMKCPKQEKQSWMLTFLFWLQIWAKKKQSNCVLTQSHLIRWHVETLLTHACTSTRGRRTYPWWT